MNPQRTPTPTVSPPPHVPAINADVPADSDHPLHKGLSHVLPAVIVLLLAALVLVPTLLGRNMERLSQQRVELVFPANDALQESRSLLTEQLAAIRGYQITGGADHLARFEDALIRQTPVSERLTALADQLGGETVAAVERFGARTAAWQDLPRGVLTGDISREDLVDSLHLGQEWFEAALGAADDVRTALNRHEEQLAARIRGAEQLERVLTVLLSIAALATGVVMVWLTTRLQRVTEALRTRAEGLRVSEERFRLIAENLRQTIWISNPDYTVQYYVSPAYEDIWGVPVEEALRSPRAFLDMVVAEDRARLEAAFDAYARGEYSEEYRIVRPDGETRWISAHAYPVRDNEGGIFLIAGIAEDITEQKRTEAERERLLERERTAHMKTEAALRMRDRVVGIVSHDLKNPLHTIGMAADLLELPLDAAQREKQIDIIRRTVSRANRMVGDLLDAARLESGRAIAITAEPLPVQPLIAEVAEAFRFQAADKNQILTSVEPNEHTYVNGDQDRLVQAFSNLVGNAVKFTPEGGRIRMGAEREADGSVCFFVSDTGPGVSAALLPHLFEPFAQARDTASLGTGLGLSIAHGIVQAHNGRMAVHSEPGRGTTFTFTLPGPTSPNGYIDPVDDTLDETFPASDPPSWWGGREVS